MKEYCIHCYVSGKVQGVWYRAHTQKQAHALGLTGWVKNLPDGRVELMACGAEIQIKKLQDWLWQGPSRARVEQVEFHDETWQHFEGFSIR